VKVVSGERFCKALARAGWRRLRSKGGHQTWGKEGFGNVTVPIHSGRDLKPGLQRELMKQTGLRESDL